MIHNFSQSKLYENEQIKRADKFYRDILHVSDIKRFNYQFSEERKMQRQDIDLILTYQNKSYKVSEKFRSKDFGDLYLEIYSKYPNVLGWLREGVSDYLMYFTPENVYCIDDHSLKNFYIEKLSPLLSSLWFESINDSVKTIFNKKIYIDKIPYVISIIKALNETSEGDKWITMGITIPFNMLKINGVRFLKFSFR